MGGGDGLGWVCLEGVVCGRRSFPPGPKPRLVDALGESDLFGLKLFKPIHCVGGGYSKQASPLFGELVVNNPTPGLGSVRDPPPPQVVVVGGVGPLPGLETAVMVYLPL